MPSNIGFTAVETLLDHIMALALQLTIHMGTKSYKKLATILSFNSKSHHFARSARLGKAGFCQRRQRADKICQNVLLSKLFEEWKFFQAGVSAI